MQNQIQLRIEDTKITLDINDTIKNDTTPERILWWVDVLSRSQRDVLNLETDLRALSALNQEYVLKSRPKASAWQVKADLERTPEWEQLSRLHAEASRSLVFLKNLVHLLHGIKTSA